MLCTRGRSGPPPFLSLISLNFKSAKLPLVITKRDLFLIRAILVLIVRFKVKNCLIFFSTTIGLKLSLVVTRRMLSKEFCLRNLGKWNCIRWSRIRICMYRLCRLQGGAGSTLDRILRKKWVKKKKRRNMKIMIRFRKTNCQKSNTKTATLKYNKLSASSL